jgi:hypothetical protein
LLTVQKGADRSIVSNLWLNGNGRIGALSGEAHVVNLQAKHVLIERCKLTGATYPSPYVWKTGDTRDWAKEQPDILPIIAPGSAFADSGKRTIIICSKCTPGPGWPGCYGSLFAAINDPLTEGYTLSGVDLVAAHIAAIASGKIQTPSITDDHIRGISWGLANGGGSGPLGTFVVYGSGFSLVDSEVGHALQGLQLCGAEDVTLHNNWLGLTGCDTIVLCGSATNVTISNNSFCGSGFYCPNHRGARSENMVGMFDLSRDAVAIAALGYVPAAGIFGGYPEIRFFDVTVSGNIFQDKCSDSSAVHTRPWAVDPSFSSCGNAIDLTGINTLGKGKAGTLLYWGPLFFASATAKTCSPRPCKLGSEGCFDTREHCQESTGFVAPGFADSATNSCAPQACAVGEDEGCFDSMDSCVSANPAFTDVTGLRFDVSKNVFSKSRQTSTGCPVGRPNVSLAVCKSCDGAHAIDIWKGYNANTCAFSDNTIAWDGESSIYVHY